MLTSQREIDAISNCIGDDAEKESGPLGVDVPKVFYPAYEFRSFNAAVADPQRLVQILIYRQCIVRVNIVTVAMRMWMAPARDV